MSETIKIKNNEKTTSNEIVWYSLRRCPCTNFHLFWASIDAFFLPSRNNKEWNRCCTPLPVFRFALQSWSTPSPHLTRCVWRWEYPIHYGIHIRPHFLHTRPPHSAHAGRRIVSKAIISLQLRIYMNHQYSGNTGYGCNRNDCPTGYGCNRNDYRWSTFVTYHTTQMRTSADIAVDKEILNLAHSMTQET